MSLKFMLSFGVGYVLGTRAGKERYAQIKEVAQRTAARLDEKGRRDGPRTTP